VLEEVMTKTMYDVPSDPTISKVIITPESVRDGKAPELVRDRHGERPRLGGEVPGGSHDRVPMRDTAS
jgi:ATP-dependent Clp protease ATP-binding subunit ClpX